MRPGRTAREDRLERVKERAELPKRPPTEQLAHLDSKLGKDTGAIRERIRLHQLLRAG